MITEHTCYTIACTTAGCDPWDDGTPHFDAPEDAIEYAQRSGWTVVGDVARCEQCSRTADCERTDRQWGGWFDRSKDGVPYRARLCDHCGTSGSDQTIEALTALVAAAQIVDAAVPAAMPDADRAVERNPEANRG